MIYIKLLDIIDMKCWTWLYCHMSADFTRLYIVWLVQLRPNFINMHCIYVSSSWQCSRYYARIEELTHWGWMIHICVSELDHHWLRQWLGTDQVTSHYLHQCWNIVNWNLRNKFLWKLNLKNSYIFIQENEFEYSENCGQFSQPGY